MIGISTASNFSSLWPEPCVIFARWVMDFRRRVCTNSTNFICCEQLWKVCSCLMELWSKFDLRLCSRATGSFDSAWSLSCRAVCNASGATQSHMVSGIPDAGACAVGSRWDWDGECGFFLLEDFFSFPSLCLSLSLFLYSCEPTSFDRLQLGRYYHTQQENWHSNFLSTTRRKTLPVCTKLFLVLYPLQLRQDPPPLRLF